MPITVIPDVVHPSSSVQTTFDGMFTRYTVVRVYEVQGLDDGSLTAPATALARSLFTHGIPPQGTPAPGVPGQAGAIALDYDVRPMPASDTSCYIVVTYRTPTPGNGVGFIVSDDTVLTVESTELHPRDKSPMTVFYESVAPAPVALPAPPPGQAIIIAQHDPQLNKEFLQATFRYSRPLRKVVISGYVINKDLDPIRAAIRSVNSVPWVGYGKGFWRFDEFRNDGALFGNIIKISVGVVTRIDENWMQWEVFKSPTLGRRISVQQADVNKLRQLGYFYGWQGQNGITVAGLYPLADFGKMFGVGAPKPPPKGSLPGG